MEEKNFPELEAIKTLFSEQVSLAESQEQLQQLKVKLVGKKGQLTAVMRSVGSLPAAERAARGKQANLLKQEIIASLEAKKERILQADHAAQLAADRLDVTLPGIRPTLGGLHPLTQVMKEMTDIFVSLGFAIAEGPEVETDFYNFEALNFPANHPAKDMHDTFYLDATHLLRTHTSPVQARVMEVTDPPVKIIAPGKVYRCDADVTHSPMFHQVEGLYVDEGVSFADLKGTLELFIHRMFGDGLAVRFRPSFFPFTEPSAEIDMACVMCNGEGCRICSQTGWLEILGAGMVDPHVFKAVNYDTDKYSGFAFGMGVERIAMLKYRISDIRLFFENDVRFLRQF